MSSREATDRTIAGRYRLASPLGIGGMGRVWRADDSLLKREVAIKEVELPTAVPPEEREPIRERVMREARAAARLSHPNAVTVFDVAEEEGMAFIVMELVRGRTLADKIAADGPLDVSDAAAVGEALLDALEAAHAEGIVHRDVKPANVMLLPDGRVKLADFGIASVKGDPKITATGIILGSPSYMAPEQAEHGGGGPRSDLWGLGATLYFAVEAVPPFERAGPIPTLAAVLDDDPRPLRRAGALAPAIEALLAKDPALRPAGAELRRLLASARAGTVPVRTPAVARAEEAVPARPRADVTGRDRRPIGKWVAVIVALVALVAAALFVLPAPTDDDTTARDGRGGGRGRAGNAAGAGSDRAQAPQNWTRYEGSNGYVISYPSGWDVRDGENNIVDFVDPSSGRYLRVDWIEPPNPAGPVGAWENFAPDFDSRHPGYRELGIEPTTFKDMDAAAWEYTYPEGDATLHAVNLGFITPDGRYGMALNFVTPEAQWAASQPVFERLKASFAPPT